MSKKKINTSNKNNSSKKNNTKNKKSKFKIILILLLMLLIIGIGIFIYTNRTEPSLALKEYFEYLSDKNYEAMYDLVDTQLSKEDFINRIKNIYEGIEVENISITIATNSSKDDNKEYVNITYNNSMTTMAGDINFINNAKMKSIDGEYKIIWDSSLIYPDLTDKQKVKISTIAHTRGTIYDKNGIALAKDGMVYQVGLVPR